MASAATYTPIATYTVPSATATYTFTSIPQTYTDLVVIENGANTATGPNDNYLTFNGDSGTNYSRTLLYGNGTSALSGRGTSESFLYLAGYWTTSNATSVINIMNYSNTTTYKNVLAKDTNAGANAEFAVGLWRSTAAITSVLIGALAGSFAAGTTFTLYGIAAA